MGACCSSDIPKEAPDAGSQLGSHLLNNAAGKAGDTGSKILERVESTFDDKVDKIINEKLLQKCDDTFDAAIDAFIDKTFETAMKQFDPKDPKSKKKKEKPRQRGSVREENKYQDFTMDSYSKYPEQELEAIWSPIEESAKRKKKKASDKLRKWGLPQLLIDTIDAEGWLDEDSWNTLTKEQLKRMKFGEGYIELFVNKTKEQIKAQRENEARQKLLSWGVSKASVEAMEAEGYLLTESKWTDLDETDLKGMKFDEKDSKIFFDNRDKHKKKRRKNDSSDPQQILKDWGIPSNLIERMKEVGWVHPQYWDDLLEVGNYELEDLGFKNGHISTFKRKFQQWKEEQDTKTTERKIKLLRKLEKKPKQISTILKRNIDVENATNEPVKVRIIGERKYGTMSSVSDSAFNAKDKETQRDRGKAGSAKSKAMQNTTAESTSDSTKERSLSGGVSAQVAATPVTASLTVGMSKKDTLSKSNKGTSHSENDRQNAQASIDNRRNKSAEAVSSATANMSQHSWEKVEVGFTEIMPRQTLVFPVQISDPNAVVYLTIFSPSRRENICENAQIDANFIKIEKINVEGYGERIRWQHDIKPPPKPKTEKKKEDEIDEKGVITVDGLCLFLEQKRISEKIIESIKDALGEVEYVCSKTKDMQSLDSHVDKALKIYEQINSERKSNDKYAMDDEKVVADVDTHLHALIAQYISAAQKMVQMETVTTQNKEEKTTKQNIKKYGLLDSNELCFFLHKNKGITTIKKINFIKDALGGGVFDVTDDKSIANLTKIIEANIAIYNKLENKTLIEKQSQPTKQISKIKKLIEQYKEVKLSTVRFKEAHNKYKKNHEDLESHKDLDSDDEELFQVSKFFDVNGYSLLKKWGLDTFYERMADEGWENPLDWVHLDNSIMKHCLGFRPGHIQIFNRKFDLWVKKYNEVRRTIPAKRKGKDGTLIVGEGETKILEANRYYEFTKIIVRKNGRLTTWSWSPDAESGGVLFLKSHQEVVLESGAKIDLNGKGFWGSRKAKYFAFTPKGQSGGGGSVGRPACGAGGGGYGSPGSRGFTDKKGYYEQKEQKQIEQIGKANSSYSHQSSESNSSSLLGNAEKKGGKTYSAVSKDKTMDIGEGGETYGYDNLRHLLLKKENFSNGKLATELGIATHAQCLGSGGGCNFKLHPRTGKKIEKRGGSGGGALKLVCEKLVMYEGALIRANGFFQSDKDPLSAGGSGGSIFLCVGQDVIVKSKDPTDKRFILHARGGGMYFAELYYEWKRHKDLNLSWEGTNWEDCEWEDKDGNKHKGLKTEEWMEQWEKYDRNEYKEDFEPEWQDWRQKIAVGIGGSGRIRIDYISPYTLQCGKNIPFPYIGSDKSGE